MDEDRVSDIPSLSSWPCSNDFLMIYLIGPLKMAAFELV